MKRGQVEFLPYLLIGLVFVIGLAIFAVAVTHIGDEVFDELIGNEYFNVSDESVGSMTQIKDSLTGYADQIVFFLLGSILLGFIALAMFSDFHPIFIVVFILFIIIMVILAGVMANVLDDVKDTSTFEDKATEFTLTNQVLGAKFPIFVGVFGAIGVLILLAKRGKVVNPV